jgi:DNA repair protein RecO (recombination protein O)
LIYLSGESLALLKLMTSNKPVLIQRIKASPGALKQMEVFLEKYLEYHLERKFKMKNTIRQLKQRMLLSN